jgi:5-formyltetrahydrofolate cyclo-ligase
MSFDTKQNLRRAIRHNIALLSDDERREASLRIFSHLSSLDIVAQSRTIALFASLADEPQTEAIIEQLAHTKRIVLPRIEGEEMEFYDISEGLHKGAFGIMEPLAKTPIEPSDIDLMILPGVLFTREGARCGRGKGFYDKYLSREGFRAYTIGVCYPCQVVEDIPTEEHDRKVDKVIF